MVRRKGRHRQVITSELDLMPMLNVFMAIIPLLLLSAAFVPVTVIQATLPAAAISQSVPAADLPLDLAIFIRSDSYVVTGNGLGIRSIPRAAAPDTARAELKQALAEIAAAHPDNHEVRIVSEPTTRYETIVQVMDLARAAGMPEASLAEAGQEAS